MLYIDSSFCLLPTDSTQVPKLVLTLDLESGSEILIGPNPGPLQSHPIWPLNTSTRPSSLAYVDPVYGLEIKAGTLAA